MLSGGTNRRVCANVVETLAKIERNSLSINESTPTTP